MTLNFTIITSGGGEQCLRSISNFPKIPDAVYRAQVQLLLNFLWLCSGTGGKNIRDVSLDVDNASESKA